MRGRFLTNAFAFPLGIWLATWATDKGWASAADDTILDMGDARVGLVC